MYSRRKSDILIFAYNSFYFIREDSIDILIHPRVDYLIDRIETVKMLIF